MEENKVEITTYKGWNIYFDVEKESFYAISDTFDRDKTKPSFASMKKFIDDFSKANVNFKPFWMEAQPGKGWRNEKIFIIGIREDGRYVYTKEGSEERFQLSSHSESEYILPSENLTKAKLEIDMIEEEIKRLQREVAKIKDVLKPSSNYLQELRKSLGK